MGTFTPTLSEQDIAVKQANKIIESIYKMDVNEHKLLLLATKKVNEMELLNQHFDERTRIVISSSEFARQYGISRQSAFEIIVEAKKSIYDREFVYLHQDPKTGALSPMYSRWFQSRGADNVKGEISFQFTSAVVPLIYLVENEYTLLDLNEVGKLKSKYSVRLYKYLMRWVNAPYRNKISYEELRGIFGLDEAEYPEMCDFKKRVLNIAVKQVKAGTGYKDLEVKSHKTGVKVTHFSFHYTKYDNSFIRNSKKVIESDEGKNKAPAEYTVTYMSEKQIAAFSNSIAMKVGNDEYPQFADLSALSAPGQGWEVLAARIAGDFKKGNFAPYLKYLQLLGFKQKNKPVPASVDENMAPDQPAPDEGQQINKKNPFFLPEPMYQMYLTKGGKLTRDQLLEVAMAENIPPEKVMLNQGINIRAGRGVAS